MFGLSPKVPEIEAPEVKKAIDSKKDMILLDVRTEQELSRGKIQGSMNLPLAEISKVSSVIPNKDKTIYVYCLSGSRSVVAVDQMVKMGYKNVFSMKSGLLSWRANQFPLV